MNVTLHPILEDHRKNNPGTYLRDDELDQIVQDDAYMSPRVIAAKEAKSLEDKILGKVIPTVLKKYDFKGRYEYGPDKCYRDVGAVYKYSVFAMLCDNPQMLEDKLLTWMGTIIRSLDFPGGSDSIRYTYTNLSKVSEKYLSKRSADLLLPYLKIAERSLPENVRS